MSKHRKFKHAAALPRGSTRRQARPRPRPQPPVDLTTIPDDPVRLRIWLESLYALIALIEARLKAMSRRRH